MQFHSFGGFRTRRLSGFGIHYSDIADGSMVRADSGDTSAIYYIAGGQKRHILDMDTVNAMGGSGAVVQVMASELQAMPSGPDIGSGTTTDYLKSLVGLATQIGTGSPQVSVGPTGINVTPGSPLTVGAGGQPYYQTGVPYKASMIGGFTQKQLLIGAALAAGLYFYSKRKGRG